MTRALIPFALIMAATPVMAQDLPAAEPVTEAAPEAPLASTIETATKAEADGTATTIHSTIITAPIAEVWTAISTPEGWRGWAAPLARWAEGESDVIETSYNPDELAGGPGAIWQQFVARIPGRLLVFRTIKVPDDFPHGEEYKQVTSFIELQPEGAGTRLTLTATGYPDSESGRALVAFFAKGNAVALEGLQRHLAKEEEPATEPPAE
jgi:uncharacterized protein YndB with AHSA1/START domain